MYYEWGDWSLDREAGLLMRGGRPTAVSRRVLDCVAHLIAHRDRPVEYDELVQCIWGHGDVSHHQLHQVIQASRRRLGDNGQSQRLIRTVGRYGYQWVGPLNDATADPAPTLTARGVDPEATPSDISSGAEADTAGPLAPLTISTAQSGTDSSAEPDPVPIRESRPAQALRSIETPTAGRPRWARGRLALLVFVALLPGAAGNRRITDTPPPPLPTLSPHTAQTPANRLQALEVSLRNGDFDTVREGLAALPESWAESPDAMLIAMRLDLHRGNFERALNRLQIQQHLAESAEDPIWQAKLLVFQAQLQGRQQAPASEQLASAQAAIDLLLPLGTGAEPAVLAKALERRSASLLLLGRHDEALRDLARSGQLYASVGDTLGVTDMRTQRARVWMRAGRLHDALKETQSSAEDYERQSDRVGALTAYIAMTRIQMELLRWQDALASSERALDLLHANPLIERRKRLLQLRALALARLGRLREARALLEEAQTLSRDRASSVIATQYLLEAGNDRAALEASAIVFDKLARDDVDGILLENQEGALLIWTIAAQHIVRSGRPLPEPSQAQAEALRNPRAIAGLIASGRWAQAEGAHARAEAQLRSALDRARGRGMRYHMTLAAEPLFDLLLEQRRIADASRLIEDVRSYDHERFDRDFHFMLLRWRLAVAAGDTGSADRLLVKLRALANERRLSTR